MKQSTGLVLRLAHRNLRRRPGGAVAARGGRVTPRQLVLVVLIEHMAIASVAAALGLVLGRLVAPWLASSSVTLLGGPVVKPVTLRQVAIVAGVAAVTVVLGTVRSARRSIRHSTLRALATEARPPRRPGAVGGAPAPVSRRAGRRTSAPCCRAR